MAINNDDLLGKFVRTGMMMRHIDGGPCPHGHGGRKHGRGMCHEHAHDHGHEQSIPGSKDECCGHGPREGHNQKHGHKRRGQDRVLTMVSMKEGINQKDLAYLLGIRPQTLGEMLQKLEERGMVARSKSLTDGRAVEVSLTDEGRARAAEVAERRAVAAADMFGALTEDEKTQLDTILDKLGAELDNHRPTRCDQAKRHSDEAPGNTSDQDE